MKEYLFISQSSSGNVTVTTGKESVHQVEFQEPIDKDLECDFRRFFSEVEVYQKLDWSVLSVTPQLSESGFVIFGVMQREKKA